MMPRSRERVRATACKSSRWRHAGAAPHPRSVATPSRRRKNELTLAHFLTLGAILFALSVVGIFLNRKNLIVLLMAIELMLAVNMNFVAFSHYLGDMHGQVFVFFILTVAAAESAIGLAILVLLFRNAATSTSTSSTR
jgi:NADH-quinone oxidoreductase subunit K